MCLKVKVSTTFHTEIDVQEERTIQTLEDIISPCEIGFKVIGMITNLIISLLTKTISTIACRWLPRSLLYTIGLFEVCESGVKGRDLVHQSMEKVNTIQERLKIV